MTSPTPEQQRAWRLKNKDKTQKYNKQRHEKRKTDPAYVENSRARAIKHRQQLKRGNPKRLLIYSAKHRAKKNNLPFSITENDFEIPLACPLLGVWLQSGHRDYAPSLDRIKPELGYVRGNVWVVSRKANLMKNDATRTQLINFARNVINLFS